MQHPGERARRTTEAAHTKRPVQRASHAAEKQQHVARKHHIAAQRQDDLPDLMNGETEQLQEKKVIKKQTKPTLSGKKGDEKSPGSAQKVEGRTAAQNERRLRVVFMVYAWRCDRTNGGAV